MTLTVQEAEAREALRRTKPKVYDKVIRYDERYARGESVSVIQLQYDYACNFKCGHCAISTLRRADGSRALDPFVVGRLCDEADEYGLAQIDLSGGEPLCFKDLDDVIKAIDPSRFYLMVDTNGWLMTEDKVKHLKGLGVDKVQVGLDSLDAQAHDKFRHRPGAHASAVKAIEAINRYGLKLQISTVVWPARVHSQELVDFLAFTDSVGAQVNCLPAKPVGEWAGRTDFVMSEQDTLRLAALSREHRMNFHINTCKQNYGMDLGCSAVKKMVTVTKYGDVLPCIWIYFSLGNIFEMPLRSILEKGMAYFGGYRSRCLTSENVEFIHECILPTVRIERQPVKIETVLHAPEDMRRYDDGGIAA